MEKKRFRFPFFWVFYVLFIAVMVVFWVKAIDYVKVCLNTYESCQPEYFVEDVVAQIEALEIDEYMDFQKSASRFEDMEVYKDDYISKITGKDITYEKAAGSYDATAPVYKLYIDGEHIATLTLKQLSSEPLMFILAKQEWAVESIEPVYDIHNEGVTIKVPDTFKVYVNDVLLEESELTGNSWTIDSFEYASEYVTVPKIVEYKVEGLFEKPEVKIYNNYNELVEIPQNEDLIEVTEFAVGQMDAELEEFALTNAKNYSNFFSRDIEGCRNSVEPISYMFPEGSYYLELAENYRINDMWMYSAHQTPVFSNEKVSEYVQYTEDFFSCDVYFEKQMTLTLNGESRMDITNSTYYYVKIDGNWVIADMKTIVEE